MHRAWVRTLWPRKARLACRDCRSLCDQGLAPSPRAHPAPDAAGRPPGPSRHRAARPGSGRGLGPARGSPRQRRPPSGVVSHPRPRLGADVAVALCPPPRKGETGGQRGTRRGAQWGVHQAPTALPACPALWAGLPPCPPLPQHSAPVTLEPAQVDPITRAHMWTFLFADGDGSALEANRRRRAADFTVSILRKHVFPFKLILGRDQRDSKGKVTE